MIFRSVLTAVTLLGLYTALIIGFQGRISHTGQTTLQRNVVKAEEYLYEASSRYDTVLVGSSMSERLLVDQLPGPCYNLAMAGFSPLDGLQLIKQSGHLPKLIYVELNTLDRGHISEAIQALDQPRRQLINTYLPFLRQKYQPVGVFKALLRSWRYGDAQFVEFGSNAPFDKEFQDKAIIEKLVEMDKYAPADSTLQKNEEFAGSYLDALRKQGVQIILYEIPIDRRIQDQDQTKKIRGRLKARFPANGYPTIDVPNDAYQTTDGIHLTGEENLRYVKYLRQQLKQLFAKH